MPRTVPTAFSSCAGMDIGLVVDLADDGNCPCAFTVKQLVFDLKPTTYEDEKPCLGSPHQQCSSRHPNGGTASTITSAESV
jgi:hypothetical protein